MSIKSKAMEDTNDFMAEFFKLVLISVPLGIIAGAILIYLEPAEKPLTEPVAHSKLKVEEWTCLEAKAGECLKWEVKETYRD